MKLWSDFYDYVLPDLPGAATSAVTLALRMSAIDFCAQSLAWTYDHPDITIVSGTNEYNYVPPAETMVQAVTYAEYNGDPIEYNAGWLNIATMLDDWRNATGTPQYVLGGSTLLQLVPNPDADGTLSIEVALKPTLSATGIDDDIFNEYQDAISHGALARMMYSPKKPYTNPALAQYHAQQSAIMTGQAGQRKARNFTRAPLRTSIMTRG